MSHPDGLGNFVINEDEETGTSFDLFSIPERNGTCISGREVEIRLFTTLESSGPFEFYIPSSNDYTLLPLTRLHGTCQIVHKDGLPVTNDVDFSIANLFPHSLFSQLNLEIDGVNLCNQDNLYPYKAYLETLLTYGHDAKYSHLTTSHFVKDSAHHLDDLSENNEGYKKRQKEVLGSKLVDFCIIPHIDFFHNPRVLPSDVPMKLKLTRANDSFSILSNEHSNLCVKIHSLGLFVYRLEPSNKIRKSHELAFTKQKAYFPFTRSVCKKYTIPLGISTAHQPNIIHGQLPRQIVIGFLKADAVNGNYKLNPFNFGHFDCSFLALRINGVQMPATGFRPDFSKKLVRRELRALYDNIGVSSAGDDSGCNLDVDDFTGGYTLFAFDLSVDKCNGYHFHEDRSGIVDLEVIFRKPLEQAITVICYAAFESMISMSKERNISIF